MLWEPKHTISYLDSTIRMHMFQQYNIMLTVLKGDINW